MYIITNLAHSLSWSSKRKFCKRKSFITYPGPVFKRFKWLKIAMQETGNYCTTREKRETHLHYRIPYRTKQCRTEVTKILSDENLFFCPISYTTLSKSPQKVEKKTLYSYTIKCLKTNQNNSVHLPYFDSFYWRSSSPINYILGALQSNVIVIKLYVDSLSILYEVLFLLYFTLGHCRSSI